MALGSLGLWVIGRAFLRGLVALIYTGFVIGANPGAAGVVPEALLTGDMAKLVLWDVAKPVPDVGLTNMEGAAHRLAEYRGKWLVVNFWATWCVPCRLEMPALDRLQMALPQVVVVTVATGPNPRPAIEKFLKEAEISMLAVWRDPDQALAHQIGVLGVPVTLIINPDGAEVGRLIGGAAWDGPEAQAVLAALMAE